MESLPVFRVPKRRKMTRRPDEETACLPRTAHDDLVPDEAAEMDDTPGTTNVIRANKPSRKAKSGITFAVGARPNGNAEETTALVLAEPSSGGLTDMSSRFVGPIGSKVVDEDKYMMAYIDSRLAERRPIAEDTHTTNSSNAGRTDTQPQQSTKDGPKPMQPQQHQLSEVDLSSLPTHKPTKPAPPRPPRKPRLGRDGKPLRPRPRKRRNSDDIARDALVEQVLHENALENVYRSSGVDSTSQGQLLDEDVAKATAKTEANADTDEAFAERFRQEFLDRVAERQAAQQQKKPTATTGPGAGTGTDKAQGPKLGGSRAARARMQLAQQQASAGQK